MKSFILTILSAFLFLQVNAINVYNNTERKIIPLNKTCTFKPNKGRSGIEMVQAYIQDGDLYIDTRSYIGTMSVMIYNEVNEIVYTGSYEVIRDGYSVMIPWFQQEASSYYIEITIDYGIYGGSFRFR